VDRHPRRRHPTRHPHRSTAELEARIDELDALFATAPPDQRELVNELLAGAQSLLGDTDTQLRDALTQCHARKDWILAHWPHLVEHAEATRTLNAGRAGGSLPASRNDLVSGAGPLLVRAAGRDERWIRTLASRLVGGDGRLDRAGTALLDEIASYRAWWDVDHPDPLGLAATTDEQARERERLAAEIEDRSRALPRAETAPGMAL
jgi:hypothetical protein